MTPTEARDQAQALVAELKQARLDIGRDGMEIAYRAGLQRYVIQTSEAGITSPRLPTIIRWAEALNYQVVLRKKDEDGV